MEAVKKKSKVKKQKVITKRENYVNEETVEVKDCEVLTTESSTGHLLNEASTSGAYVQHLHDHSVLNLSEIENKAIIDDESFKTGCCNRSSSNLFNSDNDVKVSVTTSDNGVCKSNISNEKTISENSIIKSNSIEISKNSTEIKQDICSGTLDSNQPAISLTVEPVLTLQVMPKEEKLNDLVKKQMYPNLETVQLCKERDGILSSQALVKTYTEHFLNIIYNEANKGYKEFHQELWDLKKKPLFDMIYQFQSARKSSFVLHNKLKSLDSKLKRKKNALWNAVTKTVSAQGICDDGNKVNISYEYGFKKLDLEVFKEVKEILSEIETSHITNLAFHSYVEHQMKLKIEQFLYDLVKNSVLLNSASINCDTTYSTPHNNLYSVKKNIAVLFNFQREPTNDKDFLLITQRWLKLLVPILLKNGSLADNMFIVNHVLRCPNGVNSWATQFIQIPAPQRESDFECKFLHYILVVLYMILNPVPDREQFLRNIKCVTSKDVQENFTLLDSDGEEENTFEVVRDWSEDDVLSLLNQIPFAKLFEQILSVSSTDQTYDIKNASEQSILKLFAFSTALINILISGLESNSDGMFVQLIENVCNLMRHTVCYVSDHWKNYVEANLSFSRGLQAEFDRFIFHVVYKIFSFKKLKVWKFLASLPYNLVSPKMLWSLLWIFHSSGIPEETVYSEKDIEIKLQDETTQFIFFEKLNMVDAHDALYLFNAYEKMAVTRTKEHDFICFVIQELFEAAFVHEILRNSLYKEGKILISSIAENSTFVISFLIKEIERKNENDIAKWAQILFNEIKLTMWRPEPEDVNIISKWLLSEELSSPKNGLACLILKKMNWNYDKEGKLYLPLDLHRRIAILVLTAYRKFDANGNNWIVSKGLQQILQLYSFSSSQEDKGFIAWAWNLVFSLKLHVLDENSPPWVQVYDGYVSADDMLDMHLDASLFPLEQAFDEKHPMGLYLAPVMTKIGYSIKSLAEKGLICIAELIESEQYAAAIQLLFYIMPFFVKNQELFLSHEQFISSLCQLVVADYVWSSFASGAVVGAVLQNLAAMIKHQIEQTCKISIEYASPILTLWLQMMFRVLTFGNSKDYKTKFKNKFKSISMQVYFLLDLLVKIAFTNPHTRDVILDQMNFISRLFNMEKSAQSSWLGLFSDKYIFSFISNKTLPDYPWLAFYMLLLETKQKKSEDIWDYVLKEMIKAESVTPSQIIKKIQNCPPLDFLPIYRWSFQIVVTPVAHPAFVLLCQQFFLYYLQRVPVNSNTQEICSKSVGERFFKTKPYFELLKNVKDILQNAENHYASSVFQLSKQIEETQNCSLDDKVREKLKLFNSLHLLFKAFNMWIKESSLHLPGICFSALEPKYDVEKLKLIMENDQRYWFEMISINNVKEDLNQKIRCWHQIQTVTCDKNTPQLTDKTGCSHIMKLLASYEVVKPLVTSEQLNPPVMQISDTMLTSWNSLIEMIEIDQEIIHRNARIFTHLLAKLKELNLNYTCWIPEEYTVEDTEIVKKKVCDKGLEGSNSCSGAAAFKLNIQTCKLNEKIQTKAQNNRIECHLIMEQLINLPLDEICSASVQTENCVRELLKKINCEKGKAALDLREIGVSLFYRQMEVIDKINSSVINYLPSQQFFASSVDLLGKEFIEGQDDQCLTLVKNILRYQSAGRLVSHLFKPNAAHPEIFLEVYETIVSTIGNCDPSTILVLLSKIDVHSWLNDERVLFLHRKLFFKKLSQALWLCGSHPDENLLSVYEVLKKHFRTALLYLFPTHYSDAVQLLLNGIENNLLSVDIWYETFQCFGCYPLSEETNFQDVKQIVKKFANNQLLPPEEQLYVSNQSLSLLQITETLHLFYQKNMDARSMSGNLYKKFKIYTKVTGIFLAMLGHTLVGLFLQRNSISMGADSLQQLWDYIESAYHPWIYPLEKQVCLTFPWSVEEESIALFMFQLFAMCLEYFHEKLIGINCEKSILSYAWNYYVETYVLHGFRNYSVVVCHTAFKSLPWQDFHPNACDLEGMCKVLRSNIPESRQFLADISTKIPWVDVMTHISKTKSSEYISETFGTLGKLLIISGLEFSVIKTNSHQNNLKALECLPWEFLTLAHIEEILNLYYSMSCSSKTLLNGPETCPEIYVFQFLKNICCMTSQNSDLQQNTSNQKRLLFIQKFRFSLKSWITQRKDLVENCLQNLLHVAPGFLNDIELIILKDIPSDQQTYLALPLIKEVLGILNDISDEILRKQAVEHTVEWLEKHHESPLLLPCLKGACDSLKSLDNLISIAECCIAARFNTDLQDSSEAHYIWTLISSYFEVPLTNDYMLLCAEKNAHLSFYVYILHRMALLSTNKSKMKFLEDMLEYVKKTELRESSESKIILLWDKILQLCVSLAYEQELQFVSNFLVSFCCTLSYLGEDRSRKGILASIGLGAVSPLSVKFRFLCRSMAAFLHAQRLENGELRLECMTAGYMVSSGSVDTSGTKSTIKRLPLSREATKALDELKELSHNKSYAALQSQLDLAIKAVENPMLSLSRGQELLKNFALYLFSDRTYLHDLGN